MFLLIRALLVATEVAAARQQPLPYSPGYSAVLEGQSTAVSSSSAVPVDPYFTNGVQQVWHEDGHILFEEAFGYMSRTYNVKMSMDNHFRVGSNTKLFTAVSIYQLYERGLLDVNANVADYLEQSDFEKFGFPNQTKWCPSVYGGDGSCQTITFVQLMSMSSGMVDGVNCAYAPGSWQLEYCQSYPTFQAYVGSIAEIVGGFINWPMSTAAGTEFHYTNENFILLSYLVEKLSGVSFREYLQTHIIDVIGLKNTYYDPWQSSLGPMDAKLGEEYRDYHELPVNSTADVSSVAESYYASSICSDEFNLGAFCGTGGLVSTTADMHSWFANLFIAYNPALLSRDSINALIAPVQLTRTTATYESYFGQGVGTDVYIGESSPFVIYYTGGMYCATTSIRMLTATSSEPAIIATAFRNNVIVDAPSAQLEASLNSVTGTFYDVAYVDYGWETFSDSKAIVQALAAYFQANPDGTSSSSSDDDETTAVVIAIVAGSVIVLLALGAVLLWWQRPGMQLGNRRGDKGALNAPILPPSDDDDVF